MTRKNSAALGVHTAAQAREVAAKVRRLARAISGEDSERLSTLAKDLDHEADDFDQEAAGSKRHDGPADGAETARRESYALKYPQFVQGMNFLERWAWRPSGKLTATIGEGDERGLQHRWADIATHRVEDRIDDMATEAVAHADIIRSRREELDRRIAARREAQERRRQHEAEAERLREQFAFLKTRAELFDGVEKIGRLLERLRDAGSANQSEKMRAFLERAKGHVAELRKHCSAEAIEENLIEKELL